MKPPFGRDLASMRPSRMLDVKGEVCPTPTHETFRLLDEMRAGEVLEVESDYVPAKTTIPYHCEKRGYRWAISNGGERIWQIRIEKT